MELVRARPSATMLVGRDRVFYSGRLRRSLEPRLLGAHAIYAVPEGDFEIAIGNAPYRRCRMATVPACTPHQFRPPQGRVFNILVEPESIDAATTSALTGTASAEIDPASAIARLSAADRMIGMRPETSALDTPDFDWLCFGAEFGRRPLDPRIREVLRLIVDEPNEQWLTADDYADHVSLSVSRMLRLFGDETGVPFRKLRMWKRARRFLDQANGTARLTDVALDLGYPDSSHFSNSIRRIFGMRPVHMRTGAENLQIRPCAGYMLHGS